MTNNQDNPQEATRLDLEAENAKLRRQIDKMHDAGLGPDYTNKVVRNLKAENAELKELLREYGRHLEGCSAPFGYPCRCRWDEERKVLETK